MLRQEELAFIKAISSMQLSPAILNELRMAMSRRRKKPAVPVGIRSTISTSGARAPQCLPSLLAGKRKANELACSGDSSEPAIRRPAPDAGSAPLPANSSAVTGEHASCSRHLVSPEGGETYAAVLAGSVAPLQPSGPLKPTAMDSDPSESDVSSETVNRRMSSDMSGPLSDKPDGTTPNAQVTNTCLSAGERPSMTPIFISGARDTRAFLVWLRGSCPGGLTAQLKAEKLMVVASTANGFRAAVSALRSIDGGGCEFPHLHAPGGPLCADAGEEPGPWHARERRPGGARDPGHSCPGGHAAAFRPS